MSEYWVTVKISKKLAGELEKLRGIISLDQYVEDVLKVHAKETRRFIVKTLKELRGER